MDYYEGVGFDVSEIRARARPLANSIESEMRRALGESFREEHDRQILAMLTQLANGYDMEPTVKMNDEDSYLYRIGA